MIVLGLKPGHDGAVAAVADGKLLFCLEPEKDSNDRYAALTPTTLSLAMERLDERPDIIAIGGWDKRFECGMTRIETGYLGAYGLSEREGSFCGKPVKMFSSSHERSHIMMSAGMAPRDDAELRAVLVWEGIVGTFYLLDKGWEIVREVPVLEFPGGRYEFVYVIAHPGFADSEVGSSGAHAGKLMALAAFQNAAGVEPEVAEVVDRLLAPDGYPLTKAAYRDAPFYNAGVESDATKSAAALIQDRIFTVFADVARKELPGGIPLHISGGCGLNCDWNTAWRELEHFSSVSVPPCTNDSGSALGTALDALHAVTGDPRLDWDVYCGLEFEWDAEPNPRWWIRQPLEFAPLSDALAEGRIVAWVQGRWEMGPRALGNRSLLAAPFSAQIRDCLNEIKQRESYRPIAPVCRIEDTGKVFDRTFHDPYMLFFRGVTSPGLGAVTHVDGSARAQTVTKESNGQLHSLLSAFAARHGVGVLCNTSLNYKAKGFINRMSDLVHYCNTRGILEMVVGNTWFRRFGRHGRWDMQKPAEPPGVSGMVDP